MEVMRMTSFALALLGIVSLGGMARAVLVAGGGAPRSDCYLAFDVRGARGLSTRAAECTDGDPACDLDGECDRTCRFGVAVCLNQVAPSLPNCTPPYPPSPLVQAVEPGANPGGLSLPPFARPTF